MPLVSELTCRWHLDRKLSDFSANLPMKLLVVTKNIRSKNYPSANSKLLPYWIFCYAVEYLFYLSNLTAVIASDG